MLVCTVSFCSVLYLGCVHAKQPMDVECVKGDVHVHAFHFDDTCNP